MQTGGSTNAHAGIVLAYRLAEPELDDGRDVRIVLFSDGVGNVGHATPEEILGEIQEWSRKGATMNTVGVGIGGNYNDIMLETLANRGNGSYRYVSTEAQLEQFDETGADALLRLLPRDARVQVEFNPDTVRKYRLIGYENRAVADDDFRDDTLDFGEPAFARDVTALYELKLHDDHYPDATLATARLRWKDPQQTSHTEISTSIKPSELATSPEGTNPHLKRAAALAEIAEILRKSYWAQCSTLENAARALREPDVSDQQEAFLYNFTKKILQAAEGADFTPDCQR